MTKIWVIEQGEYSDYRVVGVYSTRENAEAAQAWLKVGHEDEGYTYYTPEIVEWELDPGLDEINSGRKPWFCRMCYDGSVYDCQPTERSFDTEPPQLIEPSFNRAEFLVATVWATDREHAIKIVNEIRVQMIANNEWLTPTTESA